MRRYYPRDPYWLDARFSSDCSCGTHIKQGDRILYYPNGRKAVCEKCGKEGWALLQDELAYERNLQ